MGERDLATAEAAAADDDIAAADIAAADIAANKHLDANLLTCRPRHHIHSTEH